MDYSPYEPAPPERDRWGLNLPLAIGVVTVFLIAVIVWVIVDATRGDDGAVGPTLPPPGPITSTTAPVGSLVVPSSTTPPLLPSTTPAPVAPAPTVPAAPATSTLPIGPTATLPATTATTTTTQPPAPTGPTTTLAPGSTVPGDLAIEGRPMTKPVCTGGYITVLGSNVASRTLAAGIEEMLEAYPNSQYLRTDQSCRSLDRSGQGEPIYVVYLGPFPEAGDACQARSDGPDGAYARQLSDEVGPEHSVDCD